MKKYLKIIISLLIIFVLYCSRDNLYDFYFTKKLESMGYYENSIKIVLDLDKEKDINSYYETLNEALSSEYFLEDKFDLYKKIKYIDSYDNIFAINKLNKLSYDDDTIIKIFNLLDSKKIDFLIEYGYVSNINNYLDIDIFDIYKLKRYTSYNIDNLYKNVIYVNIGLDKDFYTDILEVKDPGSINVLCNKYNKLPNTYEPENLVLIDSLYTDKEIYLRKEAYNAFINLYNDTKENNLNLQITSAYRSYKYQDDLYNRYVARDGRKEADTYSARPGHSEHQTGLAIDVSKPGVALSKFKYTDEAKWIKDSAHLYGFTIRYPEEKENITGFMAESWHIRYVGIDIATYLYENKLTYDEYYVMFLE